MEFKDKVFLASKIVEKGYSYEDVSYGDDLYEYKGDVKEGILEDVWELVIEYKENGSKMFREKYSTYKLY